MKISVLTAVRNREESLPAMLDSLRAQSHEDYEHIVQDGASGDRTLQILQANPDPRRHVDSRPDNGLYAALNHALSRAQGEVIGVLHSDDTYADPDVLARVARCFAESGADAVYGDLDYVCASDPQKIRRHWRAGRAAGPAALKAGWMPPHPALFLRRSAMGSGDFFDQSFLISADYEAILRLFSKRDFQSVWLPGVMVKMRTGGLSNGGLRVALRRSAEDYRALRRHRTGGLLTLACKSLRKLPQFI